MRIYTSITLLSLLTLSVPVYSLISANHSPSLATFSTATQVPSLVQTGDAGPKKPASGEQRRNFFQAYQTLTPEICHRGSGRREFFWG